MKKILFLLLFAVGYVLPSVAQQDYKDLLNYFVDEKYEKVLSKAEIYMAGEKTKKDPLPYLFTSMAYFEMSKQDKYKANYPDAFKNAQKFIAKYASKDKELTYAAEYEDFFTELRTAIINEGELMMDQLKYTKAKSSYGYLVDMDPNDAGAHIMLGMAFKYMKSKKEADASFAAAKKLLTEKTCSIEKKEQKDFLKAALINVATAASEGGSRSEAKAWMDLGLELFKDDKEFMVNYETMAN
ncbi:MAG: hypothetical protein RLZZ77_580 [Bacteroidota bacterium]|jgi:tetratricopeptide (TPR) repeat protein